VGRYFRKWVQITIVSVFFATANRRWDQRVPVLWNPTVKQFPRTCGHGSDDNKDRRLSAELLLPSSQGMLRNFSSDRNKTESSSSRKLETTHLYPKLLFSDSTLAEAQHTYIFWITSSEQFFKATILKWIWKRQQHILNFFLIRKATQNSRKIFPVNNQKSLVKYNSMSGQNIFGFRKIIRADEQSNQKKCVTSPYLSITVFRLWRRSSIKTP